MPFYVFIKCWDKVSAWLTNSFEPASGNLEHDSRLSWTLRGLIEQKWLMFCRWQFQDWFLRWKFLYFDYDFHEVCSSASNGSMMVHHWSLNKNCAIWNTIFFNVLWPSDAIWWCRLGWTLAPVMTWQLIVSLKKKSLLFPSDAIWSLKSGSTLAEVMAWCLTAPSHYLNNVDSSSKVYYGIHMRTILQKVFMNFSRNMCSEITLLESRTHLLETNELSFRSVYTGSLCEHAPRSLPEDKL